MLGINDFDERVKRLSQVNIVQQGGELAYMILHDPDFSKVRREHLAEVGRKIRLKANIDVLYHLLQQGIYDYSFDFFVISAAPVEVIQSALSGIIPQEHIYGAEFEYDPETHRVKSLRRVPAGYGKVAVLNSLLGKLKVSQDKVIYVGDGNSDIHVMLNVNHHRGLTIAVSESRHISQIAQRTVLSDDTFSILVPVLEEIMGFDFHDITDFMNDKGLHIQEWNKGRTDWISIEKAVNSNLSLSEVQA
jgi:phosphoserine phosphatase